MQGLLAGLLVLSVTYFGGKGLLQRFFFRTGYVVLIKIPGNLSWMEIIH